MTGPTSYERMEEQTMQWNGRHMQLNSSPCHPVDLNTYIHIFKHTFTYILEYYKQLYNVL